MIDERIEDAKKELSDAKKKVLLVKDLVASKVRQLSEAYTQVFEEKVCKKGERLVIDGTEIDGYFSGIVCSEFGTAHIEWSPMKKDGTASNAIRVCYGVNDKIQQLLEKQQ